MAEKIILYQQVVESMAEGVMALDSKGQVTLFNDAAAHVLGMAPESVLHQPFGQVFMMEMEGNDHFCQAVLDAVYERAIGLTQTLEFTRPDGAMRVISMTTSYLQARSADAGIVVVLNDVTEVMRSREQLAQAHQELADQQRKLQEAYVAMDRSNADLKNRLSARRWMRRGAIGFVLLLLMGLGGYWLSRWQWLTSQAQPAAPVVIAGDYREWPVETRPITDWLRLRGTIQPRRWIEVVSPTDAVVKERLFQYGAVVKQGEPLLRLDTSEHQVRLRDARSQFLTAQAEAEKLRNWSTGLEVTRARRELAKATEQEQTAQSEQAYSKRLLEKGIIAQSELDKAKSTVAERRQAVVSAQENLHSVLAQGGKMQLRIAELKLENARQNLAQIETEIAAATITSPATGLIFAARESQTTDKATPLLYVGSLVSKKTPLFAIADMQGIAIESEIGEEDLAILALGQPARVLVKALDGVPLQGQIKQVGRRGIKAKRGEVKFKVRAVVPELTTQQRQGIRIGMSAEARVQVYDNPQAIVIPFSALLLEGGTPTVQVRTGGHIERRVVQVRAAQSDGLEIVSGLAPGERLLLPVEERP